MDDIDGNLDLTNIPSAIDYVKKSNKLVFLYLSFAESDAVEIRFSLVVNEKREVSVTVMGVKVQLPVDLLPPENEVTCCDQIYAILKYLNENYNDIDLSEENVVESALTKLELLTSNHKLEFLKEQQSLLYTHPNGRRYSKNLLANAILWQNSSNACYSQILADDVLSLPSIRHLRRLSSAVTVDLELSDSAIAI